jgi:NADH oxidase (H2O2-forming)
MRFFVNEKEIIVIGCGASGGTAAQFARKTDRKANITLIEQGKYSQYSKCGLPYTISDKIPSTKNLIEFSEEWFEKAKINLLLNTKVTLIDSEKHIIEYEKDGQVNQKEYSSLIIATGSTPTIPPIKNIHEDNKLTNGVYTLRTIDDAIKIKNEIKKGINAIVIGGGLIGLEMADCLFLKDTNVIIVEALPSILQNLIDPELSDLIEKKITEHIKLFTDYIVTQIHTENQKLTKISILNNKTKQVQKIPADMILIATGTKPETILAENARCKIGETGGIIVDNKSQTSKLNIYAAGDCTQYHDYITKKPILIGLGSIGVRQGMAAGINAAGGKYELPDGFLQTSTSKFFETEIASVGPTSIKLHKDEIISGKHIGLSLPEYFPGGKQIILKTIINVKSGQILSAQAVGENAAQRINTYAAAILGNMNIDDFRKLETAYAPPIAPTLDVVTLAADIAYFKRSKKNK